MNKMKTKQKTKNKKQKVSISSHSGGDRRLPCKSLVFILFYNKLFLMISGKYDDYTKHLIETNLNESQ